MSKADIFEFGVFDSHEDQMYIVVDRRAYLETLHSFD